MCTNRQRAEGRQLTVITEQQLHSTTSWQDDYSLRYDHIQRLQQQQQCMFGHAEVAIDELIVPGLKAVKLRVRLDINQ